MANRVKITIIKKMNTEDIYGDNPPTQIIDSSGPECPMFNVGDEFIVKDDVLCPEGFCSWAWADIQRDVVHILIGGSYPWIKDEGTAICCCTDGMRPAFFKVEKIE